MGWWEDFTHALDKQFSSQADWNKKTAVGGSEYGYEQAKRDAAYQQANPNGRDDTYGVNYTGKDVNPEKSYEQIGEDRTKMIKEGLVKYYNANKDKPGFSKKDFQDTAQRFGKIVGGGEGVDIANNNMSIANGLWDQYDAGDPLARQLRQARVDFISKNPAIPLSNPQDNPAPIVPPLTGSDAGTPVSSGIPPVKAPESSGAFQPETGTVNNENYDPMKSKLGKARMKSYGTGE